MYIQIDVKDGSLGNIQKLEKEIGNMELKLLQNAVHEVTAKDENGHIIYDASGHPKSQLLTKYYVCVDLKISSKTKRVCYMKFEERTDYWK